MIFSAFGHCFAVTALVLSRREHPAKSVYCTASLRPRGVGNERGQVDGRKEAQVDQVALGSGAVPADQDDDDEAVVARQPQQIVDEVLQEGQREPPGMPVRKPRTRARASTRS